MGEGSKAIVGVLLPPICVLSTHGCGLDFLLSLLLWILLPIIGGVVHCFYLYGVSIALGIINFILPPLGVFFSTGCSFEFLVSILLTALGFIPGIIYAFYIAMLSNKMARGGLMR